MAFFNIPLSQATRRMANGEITCVDTVSKCFDRIAERDGTVHAFISIQKDMAMERAEMLDSLPNAQKTQLPLFGIPIAVKDNICSRQAPTTCASKMLNNFAPPYDATVVEALIKAGAVIVGKTNLDEFAMGSSTENSAFFTTTNPHDPKKIPGGSSGGSAAAVAAGMVPAALGSDTGGSIRQPCSHCGVVGLKPTYGRVSRSGLVAFASSLDQIGPMADDVRDIGTLLEIISVPDTRDSTNAGKQFINDLSLYTGDITGLKIGLPREYFGDGLSDEVRRPIDALLATLKNKGAIAVDITLQNVAFAVATYYIICTAEASSNLARYDGVKYGHRSQNPANLMEMYTDTREEGFGAEVKRRIMIGTYVLSAGYMDAYYLKAAKVRTLISRDFTNAFSSCDLIISPVTPTTAFNIGEKTADPLQMYLTDIYTVSANLAGIPGITVPCGKAPNGMPVGVQFMAPAWHEGLLLKAAFATQCQR